MPAESGSDREIRQRHEIAHGKHLVANDPELIWGWGTPAGKLRAERRSKLIGAGAGLARGTKALEVGCGTGMFSEIFARTGASLVAVDLSGELLERARERALANVTFLHKGFEECEVDGPFDAVIGSSILHHLDLDAALPKILGLLKPGGVMSFAEPNMLNPQIALQKNIPWLKAKMGDSPDETAFFGWKLAAQLRSVGFERVEITPFDWLHPAVPAPLIPRCKRSGE